MLCSYKCISIKLESNKCLYNQYHIQSYKQRAINIKKGKEKTVLYKIFPMDQLPTGKGNKMEVPGYCYSDQLGCRRSGVFFFFKLWLKKNQVFYFYICFSVQRPNCKITQTDAIIFRYNLISTSCQLLIHISKTSVVLLVSLLKQSLMIHVLFSFLGSLAQCKFVRTLVVGRN